MLVCINVNEWTEDYTSVLYEAVIYFVSLQIVILSETA